MSDLPTLRQRDEEPDVKRRRFSADTINDLLFWGAHLCIVAISLAIIWYKIDHLSGAIKRLLDAQSEEVVLVKRQVSAVEEQTALVKQQEEQRADQVQQNRKALDLMLTSMTEIQADVRRNLEETQGISQTILDVSNQTKAASLQAASASSNAVNAAKSAETAAASAAARSTATKILVREKVVTTEDKQKLKEQEQALAAKKVQLNKTIQRVKKNGPNLMQRLFQ